MSHIEQIRWAEWHVYGGVEYTASLFVDDRYQGQLRIEVLREGRGGLHYSVYEAHQGKGFGTMMLDMAFAKWPGRKDWLLFVDDPDYRRLGGTGCHSDNGRAFADAYRRKRGLDRPTLSHEESNLEASWRKSA